MISIRIKPDCPTLTFSTETISDNLKDLRFKWRGLVDFDESWGGTSHIASLGEEQEGINRGR